MDINHLRRIGAQQERVLFIDTSQRDHRAWPTSSEFAVEFEEPLQNLTGVDVLDASIPVTMHSVDKHNNVLRFAKRTGGATAFAFETDYTPMLTNALLLRETRLAWTSAAPGSPVTLRMYRGAPPPAALLLDIEVPAATGSPVVAFFGSSAALASSDASSDPGSAPTLKPGQATVFFASYTGESSGGLTWQRGDAEPTPWAPGALDGITTSPPPSEGALVAAVLSDGSVERYFVASLLGVGGPALALPERWWASADYPDNVFDQARHAAYSLTDDAGSPVTQGDAARMFAAGRAGELRLASVAALSLSSEPESLAYFRLTQALDEAHTALLFTVEVEVGNYDTYPFVTALEAAMNPPSEADRRVTVDTPSLLFPRNSPDFMLYDRSLLLRCNVPFMMDLSVSTLGDTLGFSVDAVAGAPGYERVSGGRWPWVPAAARMFGARAAFAKANDADNQYSLRPPGVINLMGPRILLLRCREVEQTSSSRRRGQYSAGLGVLKLYDQTIAHLRFDFYKFELDRFHPLGRVPRLTFRFERVDGTLYDFKGADFHLLISVTTLEPSLATLLAGETGGRPSYMNPDYEPDEQRLVARRAGPSREHRGPCEGYGARDGAEAYLARDDGGWYEGVGADGGGAAEGGGRRRRDGRAAGPAASQAGSKSGEASQAGSKSGGRGDAPAVAAVAFDGGRRSAIVTARQSEARDSASSRQALYDRRGGR